MNYIVTYTPFPNGGMASTSRIKCYAKAILYGGSDCKVLCYKRTEKSCKTSLNIDSSGNFEGIQYEYIPGTTVRSKYAVLRRFFDIYDRWHLLWYLEKNLKIGDKVILYLIDDTDYISKLTKIIQAKGAFSILELCEIPFVGDETEIGNKKRFNTYHKVFTQIDGCITISSPLENLVNQYKKASCKVVKIPIMVDYSKYSSIDLSDNIDNPYIFHTGSLYERKDGVVGMLRAFALAKDELPDNTKFLLTGKIENTPDKNEIRNVIDFYNLFDSVLFLGYLSFEELKDKLQHASLVIINKYDTIQNRYCFSTKLGEYLAASKAVIVTNVGEVTNWIIDGINGLVVSPQDDKELSDAIIKVFNEDGLKKRISQNGQNLCKENFVYQKYSKILVDFINSFTS